MGANKTQISVINSPFMQLYFKKYGNEGKPVIILHGLFGMSDNWHNIAKILSETNIVYAVDQRNHGQSPHSPEMNYKLMAADIWELMNHEGLQSAIVIGHSMGGKTAMEFARLYPEKTEKLIVVDISPKKYDPGHTIYFDAMKGINFKASNRKEIEEQLAGSITDKGEMLFLLKNLYRKDSGEYGLKLNLEAIEANYSEISGSLQFNSPIQVPALFIKGGNSNYISPDDEVKIKEDFKDVRFVTIPDAGHWVHADNPVAFLSEVNKFINHGKKN